MSKFPDCFQPWNRHDETLQHLIYQSHSLIFLSSGQCPTRNIVLIIIQNHLTFILTWHSNLVTRCISIWWNCIKANYCPGDLGLGKQQKKEEGHDCSINTPLSVNVNLGLTARKLEFKELQWGIGSFFGEEFQAFFFWLSSHTSNCPDH